MMKCRHQRQLSEYQVGALCARDHAIVRDHLPHCPQCREELAALRATCDLLRPMTLAEAPPQIWTQVQARLTPRRRTSSVVRQWSPAFAAALLLIVVAMALLPSMHFGVPQTGVLDTDGYAQVQLAAAWDNPFSDKAALGLALIAVEDETATRAPLEVVD
ncbi:MAG: anti-sigma factor family protein [Bacteroidota bacterium]